LFNDTFGRYLAQPMPERDQFNLQIKEVLKPVLVADGFRASGTTCRRTMGEVIHVIHVPGSIHGGQWRVPRHPSHVWRALALCRIAAHLGRTSEARQFAETGIASVGPAVGLKIEFRKILAALG
jgi:hypothetical protein